MLRTGSYAAFIIAAVAALAQPAGGAFKAGTVFRIDPTIGTGAILYSVGAGTDGVISAAGLTFLGGAF